MNALLNCQKTDGFPIGSTVQMIADIEGAWTRKGDVLEVVGSVRHTVAVASGLGGGDRYRMYGHPVKNLTRGDIHGSGQVCCVHLAWLAPAIEAAA